jgi:HEXXH motif-containing protein
MVPGVSSQRASRRPAFRRHDLSEGEFDGLAAGIDDEAAVAKLRSAERSQRYVLLRTVLDAVRARPEATGPLPAVDEAWDLLIRAQVQDPAETARVLAHPQLGAWAMHVLRRVRGRVHADTPLWIDVGYLHAVAAAAGIRSGIPFRTTVPVRHGSAVLPTLGHARLPFRDAWETARVRSDGRDVHLLGRHGTVVVGADRAPGDVQSTPPAWLPIRKAGGEFSVVLEDCDPYRMIIGAARPARLTASTARRWQRVLGETWSLLAAGHPQQAQALVVSISSLVPMPRAERFRPRGGSSGDAFGAAALSEPDDAVQLAAALVHECQHAKLGALMQLVDLYEEGREEPFYAPWRDDPRPLRGLLHGVYAYAGVTAFWRRHRLLAHAGDAALANFEFALWRRQTLRTLIRLQRRPELTNLGRRFLDGVASTLHPWQSEPVPAYVQGLADAAAADHEALWRIRHTTVDDHVVDALARAWVRGRAQPMALPPARVRADASARGLDTRATLIRYWLADRNAFRDLERSGRVGQRVTGAVRADLAYVAGDHAAAVRRYLDDLAEDADRPAAWVGLGLAAAARGDRAASRTLLARPETVRQVARAVTNRTGRRPAPLALAARLGELCRWTPEST